MSRPAPEQQWKVSLAIHAGCTLGEAPFHEPESNTLRFVDIRQKRFHTVLLASSAAAESTSSLSEPTLVGPVATLDRSIPVSVTANIEGVDPRERILVGLKTGVAVLDRRTGECELVAGYVDGEENLRLRGNDGAVGPDGRLWIGTMTDFSAGDFQPEGSLYVFDGARRHEHVTGLTIPNAIGWSPDGQTMYFTHSSERAIYAFDYHVEAASLGDVVTNKRVFYRHDGPGEPDGFRVDTEGNLWHAVYGESRVIKISPRAEVVAEIPIPTRHVTCVEFVGEELFVTTASDEEAKGGELSRELGGAVFRVHVGARGLPRGAFKLGGTGA